MTDHIGDANKMVADHPGVQGLAQLGRNAIERVTELERDLADAIEDRELLRAMIAEQREHLDLLTHMLADQRLVIEDLEHRRGKVCDENDQLSAELAAAVAERDSVRRNARDLTECAMKTIPADWRPGYAWTDDCVMNVLAEYVIELRTRAEQAEVRPPEPVVEVTDEACERVSCAYYDDEALVDRDHLHLGRDMIAAVQSILGPTLGLVELREPTQEECDRILRNYKLREDGCWGMCMFRAVRAVMFPQKSEK